MSLRTSASLAGSSSTLRLNGAAIDTAIETGLLTIRRATEFWMVQGGHPCSRAWLRRDRNPADHA